MYLRSFFFLMAGSLLTACVSGDGSTDSTEMPQADNAVQTLSFFSFTTASTDITSGTGSYDPAQKRTTLSDATGTLSDDGTKIILDGGGQITFLSKNVKNVALYQIEPKSGNPSFGVYGQPTDLSTLPTSGSASYNGVGSAIVQVIDGTKVYDLKGNVLADVNFDTGLVDFAISGLQGTRTDGLSAAANVANAAQLGVTGGRLSNGVYEGGVANFTSTEIKSKLSGSEVVASKGGLFGDGGDEIGGVFVIDDTKSTGTLLVQGQYIGD